MKPTFRGVEKDKEKLGIKKEKTAGIMDTLAGGEFNSLGMAKAWQVDIDDIEPRRVNEFHRVGVISLKDSIRMVGVIHPIALLDNGQQPEGSGKKRYTIISGHRRFEAVRELHKEEPDNPKWNTIPATIHSDINGIEEKQMYIDANVQSRQVNFDDILAHIRYILENLETNYDFAERIRKEYQQQRGIKRDDVRVDKAQLISEYITKELDVPGYSRSKVFRLLKIMEYEKENYINEYDSILNDIAKKETTIGQAFYLYYPEKNKKTTKKKIVSFPSIKSDIDKLTEALQEGNYKDITTSSLSDTLKSIENLEKELLSIRQRVIEGKAGANLL